MAAKITGTVTYKVLPPDFFSVFKSGAKIEATKKIEELAKDILDELREIVEKQKYKWFPLTPEYLEAKKKAGLDLRIYLATRELIDEGIGVYKKGKSIFVGPLKGKHSKSKLTYQKLAQYLEYGTENIPARPLWRPLKSSVKRRSKILKKAYAKAMKKKLKELQVKKVKTKTKKL